jgi:hypothetical protein
MAGKKGAIKKKERKRETEEEGLLVFREAGGRDGIVQDTSQTKECHKR